MHGHTYFLEVTVSGVIDRKTGMIVDFEDIKRVVKDAVLDKLDHQYINDIIKIPTAENIVQWIWGVLSEKLKKYNVELYMLKLWETPSSFVTYKLGKLENHEN